MIRTVVIFAVGLLISTNAHAAQFKLATFSADVTPPLGHPLLGGGFRPAEKVLELLSARGWVLMERRQKPFVLVAVDWCEIRNDAYERWRDVLAEAAGTERSRVLVTSVHVHDAPVADLEAQRILDAHGAKTKLCDLDFHEQCVQRAAAALRRSLKSAATITHIGLGQARVERVASNRRFVLPDGRLSFGRFSSTSDPEARAADEGTIDPWLKTISFWDGKKPVAATHFYAVHPMSHYGRGEISPDFVGMARAKMQVANPTVFQIYVSGCSGNVTAGKYNDGAETNRPVLAGRLFDAMEKSWAATQREPLRQVNFSKTTLTLKAREKDGYSVADLEKQLAEPKASSQCIAALGLSWHKRAKSAQPMDVPCLDFGTAKILLMPAESYVEFQLFAQQLTPDVFVAVAGYGECAPGYIGTDRAWREHDGNLTDWCWTCPGAEGLIHDAIGKAFKPSPWETGAFARLKDSPPLKIIHQTNAVISGLRITSSDGPGIVVRGSKNVRIVNCSIGPCAGEAVVISTCDDVFVASNRFDRVRAGVYALASGHINIVGNVCRNVQGPMPRGQLVQFDKINGPGNSIRFNTSENLPGESNAEDAINIYASNGTLESPIEIVANWIRGGGPSTSGGGIMTGDAGGSYIVVRDNVLVDPGQYGIAIAGGHYIRIENNLVFGKRQPFTNVGIYVWNQYPPDCHDHMVKGNFVRWFSRSGSEGPGWNAGNCGAVEGWKDNDWHADLDERLLPEKIFPENKGK